MTSLLGILCMWCPKQKENLETCRKANGNLSAAFSEPLSWGSKPSVGRRRAFSFFLLPLSCHSFSSVQGFLHGTATNGLECVYLGCCTGLKMWYLTTSKSRVSLDDGFCALLGLLVTKTPRKHGSNL